MKSLTELYRIGRGPSSSHTMGPEKAAKVAEEKYPDASSFRVTLFRSLAQTGRGHGTDTVLKKTFSKPRERQKSTTRAYSLAVTKRESSGNF